MEGLRISTTYVSILLDLFGFLIIGIVVATLMVLIDQSRKTDKFKNVMELLCLALGLVLCMMWIDISIKGFLNPF